MIANTAPGGPFAPAAKLLRASSDQPAPSADAVEAQLSRILACKIFSRSRDLCRFLRFVVEQTLCNRSVRLKEYLIGVTVFERGESFNPSTDPIVRVQARRVRSKLELYYQTEGRNDPVTIDLPCGAYIPMFHYRAADIVPRNNPSGAIFEAPPTVDSFLILQQQISRAIADVLRAHLRIEQPLSVRQNPAAGSSSGWDCSDPCDAIRTLRQAGDDPALVHGVPALAGAALVAEIYGAAPARLETDQLVKRAFDADGRSAEGLACHALWLAVRKWDFIGAGTQFVRALELRPGFAGAHHWYALGALIPLGCLDQAILELKVALEFAPVSAAIRTDLAWALHLAGRDDEALDECRLVIEAVPASIRAHWVLGLVLESRQRVGSAREAYNRSLELCGAEPNAMVLASLGHLRAAAGEREQALDYVEKLRELASGLDVSWALATVFLGLHDVNGSIEWLERAARSRDAGLLWVSVDRRFQCLRTEPRFRMLLRQMRLGAG